MKKKLVGAHMSIAGGLSHSIADGEKIGCTAIQIFTHSNRQWGIKPLQPQEVDAFLKAKKNSSIESVVVHASYLLNLAAPDEAIYRKSVGALIKELEHCTQLQVPSLILHPGSRLTTSLDQALERIAHGLTEALQAVPGTVMILLENMAGQGSSIGSTLEELALIKKMTTPSERIGFCLDTCHAFAAGYSLRTEKEYESFIAMVDKVLGLEHIKAMHINDSLKVLGSHVDRHANIGEGEMGIATFTYLMNDVRLQHIPKILETPCGKYPLEDFAKNLALLHSLST